MIPTATADPHSPQTKHGGSPMKPKMLLFSGYGAPQEEDIVVCALDGTGTIHRLTGLRHGGAPSFCCRGTDGHIYAVSERPDGSDITLYRLAEGSLHQVRRMQTLGRGLCHLYACGSVLYGSCFESGDFFAVDADLTRVLWQFNPGAGANAHWTQQADGMLYLADLGHDSLYRVPMHGDLPCAEPRRLAQPANSGPRQILPTPHGLLCVNELDGTLRLLDREGQTLAKALASEEKRDTVRNFPGGACMDETGRLFLCNRGPNTLTLWDTANGRLTRRAEWTTGDWPRHIAALSGTPFIAAACTRENAVYGYRMDGETAREVFRLSLPGASCVLEL